MGMVYSGEINWTSVGAIVWDLVQQQKQNKGQWNKLDYRGRNPSMLIQYSQ
jgi:hypothetical protein